ncbi:hypothetical protein K437DRAFT_224659 [Tilletiaria anomala UBC 951]|uniref:non-specific serine/threonine protein kinase n=1 Tax=Tilletiaria anomala (strain ATCC 24038 / CBS 436.72 / UBC 951) TaxID=1037660 RepID=A0A066VT79_TILAU|nr:uncharacterized protein K437DRAFT_224659 [Tilletiaria anomala UBC 951]KDN44907.1 hypothetical protein K437DRAFT_224659 [Tilletiaria anomala UBC 951]
MDSIALFEMLKQAMMLKSRSCRLAATEVVWAVAMRFDRMLSHQKLSDARHVLQCVNTLHSDLLASGDGRAVEAAIDSLGRVGRLKSDILLGPTILKLVETLEAGPFPRSAAYSQIVALSAYHHCTTFQLLFPHLEQVSVYVVSRMMAVPSLFIEVLRLTGMTKTKFLQATLQHIVPALIKSKSRVSLQSVAKALGSEEKKLCIDCMVPILNMCLIQEQRARKQCIQELSRYLDAAYFDQMLRSYLPEILGNLVINLGYEERRHNAFTGLNFVYETLKVKKEKRTFGEWLGAESMAIHAWLNDDLNSGHGRRTMAEKKAVVKSLSELIDIVGYFITSITPQIIATLTSNFANADLRHEVLKTWRKLISVLQASDLELYLGQTVASMSSFWDTMDEAEKDEAIGMINDLLSQPKDLKEKAETVLSQVRTSQSMREEVTALQQLKGNFAARATKRQQLTGLLKDLYNDSAAVLFQALGELQSFLFSERDFVKELASGNKFDPLAGSIISALLAILARMEAASSGDIAQLAFQCLGCVGAIDPDRLDIREDEPIRIILNNFKDQDEATDFALHLIKDVLVKAFRATDNTKHQANLAFAIQELLKFCGFSTALLDTAPMHNRAAPPVKTKARWQALPRHMLDTVAPLLESRYSIQFIDAPPRELPLSHHTNSYREWLQTWTSQLIKATQGTPAEPVFSVFRGVVLEHDLTVAQHILPHLVLTVLISGPQQRRDEVREEFLGVLTLQVVGRKDNNQRLMMAQTVFGLMDHLSVWLHRKRVEHAKQQRRSSTRSPREEISVIESVIDSIPQQLLATASFQSQSYARSLLHFEQTIRQYQGEVEPTGLQDQLEKMHCIYACLDEPDGMEGISTLVRSPSLEHQIREHESTGRWTAAQSCWELKLQQAPDEPKLHLGLLNCLRNLGHYDTMQTHIRGALSHNPDWQSLLGQFEVEGACILSQWGEVARLVDLPNATSDKHALARLLLAMRSGDQVAVLAALRDARQQLGRPIIAAGKTRYALIYDSVLQLQVIQDLETIFVHKEGTQDITALLSDRVAQTLPSFRVREVLLSAHRTALRSVMKDNKASVAAAWIQTSKFARRADHRQTSYSAVLQAARLDASFSFVQRAKLLRLDDQLQAAIQVMNNNLASFETPSSELAGYHASKSDIAKANLLRSSLMEATGRYSRNEVLESYRRTAKIDETAERPWYQLGHYADISRDTADGSAHVVDAKVVNYLLRALKYGIKYFFRTLPRILTIWLDAGENEVVVEANRAAQNAPGTGEDAAVTAFRDINSHIRKAHAWIPGYQWLAVFAQLVCRVTHRNDSVWKLLQDVIGKVIDEYPQQAMWAVVGGCQSKDLERRKRFKEIIHKVKVRSTESGFSVVKAIDQALLMALQLQLLCDHPVQQKVSVLSMAQEFPKIISLESDHLLLPLQSSLVVGLPANNISDRDHQPFPDNLPCIQRFDDVVEIMNSLQKPRKLTVLGTDGASYNFLCKPKDDLRKDARLMDFDAMINKLLQSNSDSRRRKLYIRTYAVVTLNEECGLIEWVPNTVGLRHILHKLYATRNIHLYGPDVKNAFEEQKANHKTAAMVFENKALAKYPPVFHEWFLATFPEPSAWLGARLRYARTLAVMSMVGHVLGLGDRHGENILFDSVSGDTVHVDLNCLFEKGLTFEIPERVPFRLTQNLVDALGVTGPDGVFRKAAEISMTILRDNKDSLMSVLEAMIHDPLVEWTPDLRYKNKVSQNRHGGIDPRTLEARHALHTVRRKLEGYKKLSHSTSGEVSLSTPNLVDALIRDATSSHNLALMYIGWASYL